MPAVVVLCHTLSPEECSAACKLAMECSSNVRLLLLFVHIQKCFPRQPYSVLDSTMGPKLFSQAVFNLLYQS